MPDVLSCLDSVCVSAVNEPKVRHYLRKLTLELPHCQMQRDWYYMSHVSQSQRTATVCRILIAQFSVWFVDWLVNPIIIRTEFVQFVKRNEDIEQSHLIDKKGNFCQDNAWSFCCFKNQLESLLLHQRCRCV